uniref:hypothetical protein n=1 Tax=Acetatifactor sp. TaxID=1872090 RepID=UPI00405711F9
MKRRGYSAETFGEEKEERIADDNPSPEDLLVKKDEQMTLYRMIQMPDGMTERPMTFFGELNKIVYLDGDEEAILWEIGQE